MEDFERWLIDELETQTLTDELKDEILERVRMLNEDTYTEVKHQIIEYIKDNI